MRVAPRPALTATPTINWETSLAYALSTPAKLGGVDIVVFHSYPCYCDSEGSPSTTQLYLRSVLKNHFFTASLCY